MTAPVVDREIPRKVWAILASWGVAVLIMASLLSYWIWSNDREQARRDALAQQEQDRAMCVMLDLFTEGPAPVPGPAGERSRQVVAAMTAYQATLRCDDLPPQD